MTGIKDKNSLPQEDTLLLLKIQQDLTQAIAIIKKVDAHTEQQLNILSSHGKQLKTIETIASQATMQIAENTLAMASHLKDTVDTNRELIHIIAGKKQVPLNIFIIVLFILAMVEFIVLSQIFSVGFEFDGGGFKGKIIPHVLLNL